MDNYSFERINKDNLKHLVTLYKNAFNVDVSIEFLKKKYDTKSFGLDYVGFLAMSNENTPAAYYGVFPLICKCNNIELLCAQSGDTMTHQDHRGKGLFIELAKLTYELAKDCGVKFVFGFPNKNSYPGFVNKLNWIHKEDLNIYKIKITTFPLAKIVKKLSFLQSVYSFYCSFVICRFKTSEKFFENSVTNQFFCGIKHDKGFFAYKSYYKSFVIEINNKKVWLKFDGRLWIGDIEKVSESEFEAVLKILKRIAFFCGASDIVFHGSPNTDLEILFSQILKQSSSLPIGYLVFDPKINIDSVKYHSADLDTF